MNQCNRCLKPFIPVSNSLGLYCSRSCAAKVNNAKRKKVKICQRCGTTYEGKNRMFCSQSCSSRRRQDAVIKDFLSGKNISIQTNGELKKVIKTFLIKESDYKCSRCGWGEPNPILGRPILTIDHIDGNWKNNTIENLVVLCYNCHTLTETFGSLNKNGLFNERPAGKRTKSIGPLV